MEKVESIVFLTSEFGTPYENLKDENFSVRWLGNILIPETAKYKFIADGNKKCKVFIDDKLIIDGEADNSSEYILLSIFHL